jgi:glutamine cyclotransferase
MPGHAPPPSDGTHPAPECIFARMLPKQKHRILDTLRGAAIVAASLVLFACRGQAHRAAAVPASESSPPAAARQTAPTYAVVVVHEWPHDATAFTEGLEWRAGFLYEGTGIAGRSRVQRTDVTTGVVSQHADLAPPYFGEGITIFGETLYELTWHGGVVFTYDARTLRRRGQLPYAGECWGLTHDDHSLILSDGTNVLRYPDDTSPAAHTGSDGGRGAGVAAE